MACECTLQRLFFSEVYISGCFGGSLCVLSAAHVIASVDKVVG